MPPKKQLITLGQDGELALKSADGSIQKMPVWDIQMSPSFVYLVIDCSGSMAGKKLEQAKRGSIDFAESARNDGYSIGLISFSDSTLHLCAPTSNLQDVTAAINRLTVRGGGTDMTPAIEDVISRFKDRAGSIRAMVIVTDGITSNPLFALGAADKAKKLGISILTIGTDDADLTFLSKLASDTKLAKKVAKEYLEQTISSVAKMLPRGN